MELTNEIKDMILNAEGKALATLKDGEPHVVPVSTVKIEGDKILLVNYFMGQTLKNALANPKVSLTAWRGLEGFQIKAEVEYITDGELFEATKEWVAIDLPERVVLGVLMLTPTEVYDVSATIDEPGKKIM